MPRRSSSKTRPDRADVPLDLLEPPVDELGDEDRWVAVRAAAGTVVADVAHDVELRECLFTGVDLGGRDLRRLHARDVRFEACDLSGAVLDSASLRCVEFVGCRMTGMVLTDAQVHDVAVRDCRADLANFRMTSAEFLLMAGSTLREADFYQARFANSALLGCDLREATFRDCRFTDVDLHGSRLDDLRDARGLGGASVGQDQVVPLALALLAAQGVAVTERARLDAAEG